MKNKPGILKSNMKMYKGRHYQTERQIRFKLKARLIENIKKDSRNLIGFRELMKIINDSFKEPIY